MGAFSRRLGIAAVLLLAGCTEAAFFTPGPAGQHPHSALTGAAVRQNTKAQIAYGAERLRGLSAAFRAETDEMATFPFDSARLDPAARSALDSQIGWLKRHPGVRMSVTGHADLVGPERYNDRLGLARARAVVDYMIRNGIAGNRLDQLISRGENDPLIPTAERERRNRRVVTSVAGLDRQFAGFGMDGRKALVIYRTYLGE